MKVIIVSDSHGKAGILEEIVKKYPNADAYLHCGDIEDNPEEYPMYEMVNGNNDYFYELPTEKVIAIGKHKIYMTHGHLLSFRKRHEDLVSKAKERGCDIACYGHSHIALLEKLDGVLIVNPGSLWRSRDSRGPSYAILEIDDVHANAHIEFLPKKEKSKFL